MEESVNGAAYTLWQDDTNKTTATYTGEIGKTYSFYSIATDNIGRTEAKTATAETTTTLVPIAPTLPTISVVATDDTAAETKLGDTPNPGKFTLTRTGATTADLTVNYTISGTATNTTDYQTLSGKAIFLAGNNTTTIDLNPTDDNTFEGNETVTLTLANGTTYTVDPLKLSGTVTIADNDLNVINGTPNADNLVGTNNNDSIDGKTGNDIINGGAGNDIVFGGAGVDLLFGGAGRDIFGYNSPTEGIDKINDFVVGDDLIAISRTGFGGNTVFGSNSLVGGTLDISRFTLGTAATTASQRFIYNPASGALFFDADGVGGTAQVRLAQLVGNPNLTNNSFTMI